VEAGTYYRKLADNPNLAMSLNNLARSLKAVARQLDADVVAKQARRID
jgi:hypothetical protein